MLKILYNKELYEHCETQLLKAERLIEKYELIAGKIELCNWKRKLEQAMRPHNYQEFKNLLKEQQAAIRYLEKQHRLLESCS